MYIYTNITQHALNCNALFGSCSNEGKGECDVFPHPNMEIIVRRERKGRTCRHIHGRPVADCFITLGTLMSRDM